MYDNVACKELGRPHCHVGILKSHHGIAKKIDPGGVAHPEKEMKRAKNLISSQKLP